MPEQNNTSIKKIIDLLSLININLKKLLDTQEETNTLFRDYLRDMKRERRRER